MGMTLWLHTLEGRTISKNSSDHTAMYRLADQLDGIADSLGVARLSSFFDDTELKLEAKALMEEATEKFDPMRYLDPETGWEYGIDEMTWYDARAGLATLEALREYVASHDSLVRGRSADLLAELDDCISMLREPSMRDARFHLAILP